MSKEYLCIVGKHALFAGRVKMFFLRDFRPTQRPFLGQVLVDGNETITIDDLGNGWLGKGDYESHAVRDNTPWVADVEWSFGQPLDSATGAFRKYIAAMKDRGWRFGSASAIDAQWPKWDREAMSLAQLVSGMSERRQKMARIYRGL